MGKLSSPLTPQIRYDERRAAHGSIAKLGLIFGVLAVILASVNIAPAIAATRIATRFEPAAARAPDLQSGAQLTLTPVTSTVEVGTSTVVTVNLASVTDLYGYQFQVGYDSTKVNAVGAFVNGFFDTTTDTFVPSSWNAVCSGGTCSFAATKTNPGSAVSGSGPLAQITFTGVTPGIVPVTFASDLLSDRNGFPITVTVAGGTLTVYGSATITGTVTLQGRTTPITPGTVTLTDSANKFSPTISNFDQTTGVFSATVPVDLGGSTYTVLAAHSLYLSNQLTGVAVSAGGNYGVGTTRLRGGDANNDGTVDILDLSCIGGSYHRSPGVCGTSGSSDINADGLVDILDLVLAGGNYHLSSPQPW